MQIIQVATSSGVLLNPGEVLPIAVGETLKVYYSFNYKVAETIGVEIWASLYKYSFGILDRQGQSQTKETIELLKALTSQPYEGEIDIVIGDMPSGTYGLICELPHYDVEHKIDDCLEVAAPVSIFETIGPILVIGLLAGLVVPMMREGG